MDKKHFPGDLFAKVLFFSLIVPIALLPSISLAVDCSNPPSGFGASWVRAYKEWCESCGGVYSSSGPSCTPGPNWDGRQETSTPSYDDGQARQRQEAERLYQEKQERQRQRKLEEQQKEVEERRQKEFERNKQEVLQSMKGTFENEVELKGTDAGGLGLKAPVDPSVVDLRDIGGKPAMDAQSPVMEPPASEIRKGIDAARKRIPDLEREVKGLQTLLRQFGASMRGNVSEFETWQETFKAAADNSWKNAKEYGLSMFLQYNLLGSLEGRVRKDAFGKLDDLINSSDPKMRQWLGEQLKKRNIGLDRVKKTVAVGNLGGDAAALLSGDPQDDGKTLGALLFVNDLLETAKVVSWTGSHYFQQAKMIGETYTDCAAFGLSCVNVRKVGKATDAYNREINFLSTKLKNVVKEINCLQGCLDGYSERCQDRCMGKTRFGVPPPSPR
ncbi:MAG: hypothetical protein JW699_05175 [Chitinispirillaceae bacterium]|nr:hypothetical protein [Chitinispirillaceae bacterium]